MVVPPKPQSGDVEDESYLDRAIDAINDPYRRQVLYHLREAGTAQIETIAERIAARESCTETDHVPDDVHRDVLVALHHRHLPKLSATGLIDYDHRSGSITFEEPREELERLLDTTRSIEDDTHRRTGGTHR